MVFGMYNYGVKRSEARYHQSCTFCLYLEGSCKLHGAGIRSRIDDLFSGVLAYADNIALLTSSGRTMRYMLKLCDDYVNPAFSIMFNQI